MTILGIALAAWMVAVAASDAAAAPTASPPALPESELQLIAGNSRGASFLVLDGVVRSGDLIDFWFYNASASPTVSLSGKSIVQMLEHNRIDCRKRTVTTLFSGGYDPEGGLVVSLPEDSPGEIRPGAVHDFFAQVLCDGVKIPDSNKVRGYRGAMERTQLMLGGR